MITSTFLHKVCRSYPEKVIIPALANDDIIKKSGKFRQDGRFPVLCYLHNNKVPLLRSSQPLNGSSNKRSKEDQRLLALFLQGFISKGVIVDTRQNQSAISSRGRGGGFESEENYPQWKRVLQNIDRPFSLSESLGKLYEACQDARSAWLNKLESSGWFNYVQDILETSLQIAKLMHFKNNTPVLVHGDKGTDCTLQITSLVQVLLNPDCRTIIGFQSLIVREWIWGGHPFTERHLKIGLSSSTKRENAPVFLMFLDCVYQVMLQYPSSFEFTDDLLQLLVNHAYASEYGKCFALTLVNSDWQGRTSLF